ncbi:Fe-S cluster biogenesis protein NfuA, 4Fe-4S-binding domain [Catalinimonas alkaloidigena]|uniref:Fe-S cluster biogenesis protein NfuA, 4Fe-4S-binding domain n=1 Tax=Catalinimonas alkaloidigena TaxID=1075417 RepID=A0A1G9MY02_9BACT|nr:NifU family protein [Catalinimonas alkaloidigena]SDL78994.1 Fe-S cluster biogenesis protein NfuA, 4Fe-4S-binding domain [Catalinimonas alkaloidigena]
MNPTKRYINLYTEANPNPNSLKFVVNIMLVPDGTDYDFPTAASAAASPLAQQLFALPYVERVFFMSNFVTVTKSEQVDWEEVKEELKRIIKSYLEEDRPVVTQPLQEAENAYREEDAETVQLIKGALEEYVRPAVESDGGAISFRSYHEGVVTVELRGACSGCPSSTMTLKSGIENLLKQMVPGVKEVIAEGV